MRINRYLALCGLGARRYVESLIKTNRVQINNQYAQFGDQVNDHDIVMVDTQRVFPKQYQYYLFFKPLYVLTTLSDPKGRSTIKEYIQDIPLRVFPVGRLDFDTQGLLILTNDGEFSNRISHPRYEIEKEYIAKVSRTLSVQEEYRFRTGIHLDEGITKSCFISPLLKDREYRIILTQGWSRQIRRMFESFSIKVLFLKRIRIANLKLQGLKFGEYRMISVEELKKLKKEYLSFD